MADLKYIKVDPITGKKVIVALKDVSPYWIYDTKTIAKDARTVSFFSDIEANNEIASDMLQPNSLPSGWKFVMFAIRFVPDFAASADDIAQLVFNSVLEFTKEGSEIFKAPAFVFNAGAGVPDQPTNGYPTTQGVLNLPLQIEIGGSQPFAFNLIKSVSLNNDVNAKVQLDGIIYKNIITA